MTMTADIEENERERVLRVKRRRLRTLLGAPIPWGRTKRLFRMAKDAVADGDFTEAVRLYRKLAERGDAEALFQLGSHYYKGRGVVLNLPEAVVWMQRAAERGHAGAQFFLGQAYLHNLEGLKTAYDASRWYGNAENAGAANRDLLFPAGISVPRDEEKAVHWLEKAAAQNHALAMVALARRAMATPDASPEAMAKAVDYLKKAVSLESHPAAEYELARIYVLGRGVERDVQAAKTHFSKAAEAGMTEAAFQLGLLLAMEPPPVQDLATAARCFQKAAERGHVIAQLNLGNFYWQGRGVERDTHRAAYWFRKAAQVGNPVAQLNLGLFHEKGEGVEKDAHEAASLYLSAAQQGNAAAQFNYANLCLRGRGTQRNGQEAATWYLKAALQGHVQARVNLAMICGGARLGTADYPQALMWVRLAHAVDSDGRLKAAIDNVEVDLVSRMNAEQIAEGEAMFRDWTPDFDRAMAALLRLHTETRQ